MDSLRLRAALAVPFASLLLASTGCPAVDTSRREAREMSEEARQRSLVDRYYRVLRQDLRKCMSPICGGVFVAEVNRAESACVDGSEAPDCYAGAIDWSALGLGEEELAELPSRATAGEVLIRGRLVPYGEGFDVAKLVVSAAWLAASASPPSGGFYQVKDAGIVCVTYPCGSLSQLTLNSGELAQLAGIDLTTSGAVDADLARAQLELGGAGVMVAGTHEELHGPGGSALGLVTSALYLPVGGQGEACGDVVCGAGEVCCNASCSQSTKPDMACTQIACDEECGHSECSQGSALTAGCSDCAALVCAEDPYCCSEGWDGVCVEEAQTLCSLCAPPPAPACAHSECDAGGALEGACSPCAAAVCAGDSFCCESAWDSLCVKHAEELCVELCAAPAPSCAHDVCATGAVLEAGCSSCAGAVCELDAYCCTSSWDELCVSEAADLCGGC